SSQTTSAITSKTEYLSRLSKAVATTQESINKELTVRMQEDKLRQDEEERKTGGDGVNRRQNKVRKDCDEAEEEANYGEEEQGGGE
ncbi:MAG: hypothetical protein MJA30_00885, partial [Cytophagales bacterium]|nr:hypothetical protein [Cytophagales bacterium]